MAADHEHIAVSAEVTRLWTSAVPTVRSFLFSSVRSQAAVDDLLQEVAMTVVARFQQFEAGSDFVAWAITIARYKALNFNRTQGRDRHVFNDQVLQRLGEAAVEINSHLGPRHEALEQCMGKLSPRHQQILRRRYEIGLTVNQIAEADNATPAAIAMLLHRIRVALRECIERQIGGEQT